MKFSGVEVSLKRYDGQTMPEYNVSEDHSGMHASCIVLSELASVSSIINMHPPLRISDDTDALAFAGLQHRRQQQKWWRANRRVHPVRNGASHELPGRSGCVRDVLRPEDYPLYSPESVLPDE